MIFFKANRWLGEGVKLTAQETDVQALCRTGWAVVLASDNLLSSSLLAAWLAWRLHQKRGLLNLCGLFSPQDFYCHIERAFFVLCNSVYCDVDSDRLGSGVKSEIHLIEANKELLHSNGWSFPFTSTTNPLLDLGQVFLLLCASWISFLFCLFYLCIF